MKIEHRTGYLENGKKTKNCSDTDLDSQSSSYCTDI